MSVAKSTRRETGGGSGGDASRLPSHWSAKATNPIAASHRCAGLGSVKLKTPILAGVVAFVHHQQAAGSEGSKAGGTEAGRIVRSQQTVS